MDPLDRLHGRLVDAVRRASSESRDPSLTIADIYQHLVPYRLIRAELGFSELKEYEHALLRLLAGERGYVKVDLDQVAEEFRRELRSPNPILGIYRDYAAVGVRLTESANGAASKGAEPRVEAKAEARTGTKAETAGEGAAKPATVEAEPPARPAATASASAVKPEEAGKLAATQCWSCEEPLPANREVRFCPHCGMNQSLVPCAECGAVLEPEWRFCIDCGAAVGAAAAEKAAT